MRWQRRGHGYVSADGVYAIRGVYLDGQFAWGARVIETDVLIASSADRAYVEQCVERHAKAAFLKAHAEAHGDDLGGHPHDDNGADLAYRGASA